MRRSKDPIFAPARKKHPFFLALIIVVLFIIVTVVAFNYINNIRVTLLKQSITIPSLPKQAENLRILHISDLHGISFGPGQSRLKDTCPSDGTDRGRRKCRAGRKYEGYAGFQPAWAGMGW